MLRLLIVISVARAQHLDLKVGDDGAFTITRDGAPYLSGSEYQVAGLSAAAGSLQLTGPPTAGSGTDALGTYKSLTLSWAANGSADVLMQTSFRQYPSDPGAIAFEQKFPKTLGHDRAVHTERADERHQCRVVTRPFKLTESSGYSAYTPSAGGVFGEHVGKSCDAGNKWALSADLDRAACKAKCHELSCTCYEHSNSPAPAPLSSTPAARTLFPAFDRLPGPSDKLDCFSYHGVFPKLKACTVATYAESHQGGAPLVLYDSHNASLPMAIFSPLNFPKAHHMAHATSWFGAGVKASVTKIPSGWSQLFLLSAGLGINDGFMAWGDRMLKFTGKPRADMYLDATHSMIGFWTDNGGYYHYATGDKKYGDNYEEVLPKVKAYHDSIGVPFGHWQFDSWFYPKDGGVNPGGGGGAVTNWTADPAIFPHGMAYIQSKLGLPTVMHNRQWSIRSDYIHNLSFAWYTDKKAAVPVDPPAFFEWFFQQQNGWGLSMYEQVGSPRHSPRSPRPLADPA